MPLTLTLAPTLALAPTPPPLAPSTPPPPPAPITTRYVAFVIKPSYAMHERMGILKQTITGQQLAEDMSFRNFFSG